MKFDGLPGLSNQVLLSGSKRYHSGFLIAFLGGGPTAHIKTKRGHLYEIQVELKNDICQENIDRIGILTTFFFHDIRGLTPLLFSIWLFASREAKCFFLKNNNYIANNY